MVWFLTLPWLLLSVHTLINAVLFKRLASFPRAKKQPLVTILVPARNEEISLPVLLPTLLAQNYPQLEIIILNDHSTDGTQTILESISDRRLRVIQGGELQAGWRGKANACDQLAKVATGEILIFTDADTIWHPDATQHIVAAFEHSQAEVLSAWSEQILTSRFSRWLQPFIAWSTVALMPMPLAADSRFPDIVSANGQLFAYTKAAYNKFGGFARVKSSVLEDIDCAKLLKKEGYNYRFFNALGSIKCKMYNNDAEVIDGFSRGSFAVLNYQPVSVVGTAILFLWLFIAPIIWFLLALLSGADIGLPALTVALMIISRARTDLEFGFPIQLSLTTPISAICWTYIAFLSWYRYATGRISWKGRTYDMR